MTPAWAAVCSTVATKAASGYADLKSDLAVRHEASSGYTRAKTELIQELPDRARAVRGLPSVPVWEE
jgi:hypothetical protein